MHLHTFEQSDKNLLDAPLALQTLNKHKFSMKDDVSKISWDGEGPGGPGSLPNTIILKKFRKLIGHIH